MATEFELREKQKKHLGSLLKIKKVSGKADAAVLTSLNDEILNVVIGMSEEDVALVEKLVGVKAL